MTIHLSTPGGRPVTPISPRAPKAIPLISRQATAEERKPLFKNGFPLIPAVAGLFGLAAVACAWIVIDPLSNRVVAVATAGTAADAVGAQVTRAETADPPGTPVAVSAPAPLPDLSDAQKAPQPMQNNAAGMIIAASGGRTPPVRAIRTDTKTIGENSAAVMQALGLAGGAAAPSDMQALTGSALSRILAATGAGVASVTPRTALQSIVIDALRAGRSDTDIDALVNGAALTGRVSVPEIPVTSDGRVDTAVLLAAIVSQAQIAAGGAAPVVPEVPQGSVQWVEERVVQRTDQATAFRFYTVSPGDSPGSISVKFFGSVGQRPAIPEIV